mmetsp:Transcript_13938/g.52025  ORF Transcript_13938/g.52025 Transcript_13938/m.52025 type:complete len:251 (-) Transcript_13938:4235-4987(-)
MRNQLLDHLLNLREVHAATFLAAPLSLHLVRTVWRVLLAHDALEVAVVGVGVERDSPRSSHLLERLGRFLFSHDLVTFVAQLPVEIEDLLRVLANAGNLSVLGSEIPSLAQKRRLLWMLHGPPHRVCKALCVAMLEGQAIDRVANELPHPAKVRGDGWDAALQRFLNHQRTILLPDRRHHDAVHVVKDRRNDVHIVVLAAPLEQLLRVGTWMLVDLAPKRTSRVIVLASEYRDPKWRDVCCIPPPASRWF